MELIFGGVGVKKIRNNQVDMYVVISAKEKNKERWRGRVSKDSILNNGGRQWSPVEEEFEQ